MSLYDRFERIVDAFDFRATGKWFALSALVGVVAGLGGVVFQLLTQLVIYYTLVSFAGFAPAEAIGEHSIIPRPTTTFSPWMIVAMMTAGGLVSGLVVYTFAPEAEGHGTDAAINAFHNRRGLISPRVPIVKTIASAVTIGTGGSAGREGPIAQIGAGFASYLATKLKLSPRDRRVMLAAGMGAGVGAIFRAPLAGALFAGEILYRDPDIESDVIVPAAISSIIAYSVFNVVAAVAFRAVSLALPWARLPEPSEAVSTFSPLFGRDLGFELGSFSELLPMGGMAIMLVLAGILYIKTFYGTHHLFGRLPIVPHVRPAIGAALAGLIGVGMYFVFGENRIVLSVLSTGYGALQKAFANAESVGINMLLIVAFGKILTTSLTIGSGGSGGVFGPSMVIGGCLGAAFGLWLNNTFGMNVNPGIYAIVGMAGFFGGCAHAPISTIIMVSEMTGAYKLLLPTMWVCTLCFLFCRRWTLYIKQVPTRLESPAHKGDFIVDLLEGIKVREVYRKDPDLIFIPESASLDDIVHRLAHTHQHYFPVVDDANRMVGIFSSDDVRSYLYDEIIWNLAVARDIMVTNIVSVTPEDDLNTALQRFTSLNLDELPVLDPKDPGILLGMLRRKETISFYNKQLMSHKQMGD